MEVLPHERCNFITEDQLILLGARPEAETLPKLIAFGITVFVNLEETSQPWYQSQLTDPKYTLLSLPIKNGSVPNKKEAVHLVNQLVDHWKNKEKIYVHCKGGHGRAGLIGSLFVGFVYAFDASEAIRHIELCRETRIDKSRNFVPTPETNAQVKFIVNILHLKDGHTAPERNDKSWLSIIRKERNRNNRKNETVSQQTADDSAIYFYEKKDPYYEFSNFYLCKFTYNGVEYNSSEHAFQAAKFLHEHSTPQDIEYSEIIRNATTPNIARILALQKTGGGYPWRLQLNIPIQQSIENGVTLREDWDDVKVQIMQDILLQKFTQNEHCKQTLLQTNHRILVENSPRDKFWGNPLNMLGKTLMKVREIIR